MLYFLGKLDAVLGFPIDKIIAGPYRARLVYLLVSGWTTT